MWTELTVKNKRRLTRESAEISFEKPASFSDYLAGQYVTVECDINNVTLQRCYSLASSPTCDDTLNIGVKKVRAGKVSHFLVDILQEGDKIKVLVPRGNFIADESFDDYVMFAGGSGFTPIFSLLKTLLKQGKRVLLFYSNKDSQSIMYKEDLFKYQKEYPKHFTWYSILTNSIWRGSLLKQRLSFENTLALAKKYKFKYDAQYFICGPKVMMDNVKAGLEYYQIEDEQIVAEYFNVENNIKQNIIQGQSEYTGKLYYEGRSVPLRIPKGVSALDAILDTDVEMRSSCKNGICGSCIAKVKSGDFIMTETDGISEKEKQSGYCLTCITYPLSDNLELQL